VIEEMAGSDRSPDPHDSQRAQVGKAQTFYESEMARSSECTEQYAQKVFDSADIVRDRDFSPLETIAEPGGGSDGFGLPTIREWALLWFAFQRLAYREQEDGTLDSCLW